MPYGDLFVKAGAKYGVSPRLLAAVAKVESGYNPQAVSKVGAQGLMQLMPGTARGLGVHDSFDPAQAIDGGAKLLSRNLREFKSVPLAMMVRTPVVVGVCPLAGLDSVALVNVTLLTIGGMVNEFCSNAPTSGWS